MQTEGNEIRERLSRGKRHNTRECSFGTKVTKLEEADLIEAAKREHRGPSEWAREVLLREARRSKDDAYFIEIVATRMLLVNLLKPLLMGQKVTPERLTEIMATVRTEKRKAAQEVMQQYTTND